MPRRSEPEAHHDGPDEGLSKTHLKQAMHDLQGRADALIALPEAVADRIDMEESLRDALREIRSIRSFEARRRQSKYIGKLLRQMEHQSLQAALDAIEEGRAREARSLQDIERWRERRSTDDAALTEYASQHPGSDLQGLRAAIRSARREAAANPPSPAGPPVTKGRYYRELFKLLRDMMRPPAAPEPDDE